MGLLFEVLFVQGIDDLVCGLGSHFLLEVLDQAVCTQGVGYHAMELEVDADADPVSGHQGRVFLHLLFRVVVFCRFVPGIGHERVDCHSVEYQTTYHSYLSSPWLLASG